MLQKIFSGNTSPTSKLKSKKWPFVITSTASIIIGIAIVAIFGYVTELIPTLGWGHITRIALSTSIGLVLLGICLFLYGQFLKQQHKIKHPLWMLTWLVPVTAIFLICLFFAQQVDREANL